MKRIPNILSSFRIIAAPILLILAWMGYLNLFVSLLITALLSDFADGFIARKFKASSNLGAKLDTIGDQAIYLTLPLCAWWLWPQIFKEEFWFILMILMAYIIPILAGLAKFRTLPTYHTWSSKISGIITPIAILALVIFEFKLAFRIVAILQIIIACESIIITVRLPMMQSNVKSIWHVNRQYSQNKV